MKQNKKQALLQQTEIREVDFNLLFGSVDDFFKQIETYRNHDVKHIIMDKFRINPQDGGVKFDFDVNYNLNSQRKENLWKKLNVAPGELLDMAYADAFNVYVELFCSNEYFLSIRTIWGIYFYIMNVKERDIDLLFDASPLFKHLVVWGGSYIIVAQKIQDYIYNEYQLECLGMYDIFMKFNSKQEPTMVIGWNNLRELEDDPIVINTEFDEDIERDYIDGYYDVY